MDIKIVRIVLIDLCRQVDGVDNLKQIFILPVLAVVFFVAMSHDANAASQITGTATTCTSTTNCSFTMHTGKGTGSANTTSSTISFRLPGESKSTSGSYSTHVISLTGTYLYNTGGSFTLTDASTNKIVTGSTNTFVLITAHCQRGCTYTTTLINGSISFTPTNKDGTSTTVTCSLSSFTFGGSTKCTVTVIDTSNSTSIPTGKVAFTSSSTNLGTLHPTYCTLSSGSCSVTFTANQEYTGAETITGSYKGDTVHYISSASTSVTVTGGN